MEKYAGGVSNKSGESQNRKTYAIFLFGVSLVGCGHYALLNLQSSLNVEGGLGTTGLTVLYGATVVSGLLLSPVILHFACIRTGIIMFDVSAIVYCAVNYYPELYTLIPGSLICGIGKSMFWICSGGFIVYFANEFSKYGNRNIESYISDISGYNFSALQAAQVVGNLVPYFAFEYFNVEGDETDRSNTTTTPAAGIYTTGHNEAQRPSVSEICGAKDCQDPNITAMTISNYVPPDPITTYIVFSIFMGLTLIATLLHVFFAPSGEVPTDSKKLNAFENNSYVDDNLNNNLEKHQLNHGKSNSVVSHQNDEDSTMMGKFRSAMVELMNTTKHFFKPFQLLLTGLQFHVGISRAFVTSEITRSYVSCVFGVAEVGIATAIYAATTFVVAVLIGKVTGRLGRKIPLVVGFLSSVAVFIFCLLWVPTENSNIWIVYGLLICCGFVDTIWMTLTMTCTAVFFPEETTRAFICWVVWSGAANLVQYGWSTSLCVSEKIYALLGTVTFGVITQGIAEYLRDRKMKSNMRYNEDATKPDDDRIVTAL